MAFTHSPPPPGAVTTHQSNCPPNPADDTGDGPRNNGQTKTKPISPSVHTTRPTKDLLPSPTAPSKIHTHIKTNGPQHYPQDPLSYTTTMIPQKERKSKKDRNNFDKFLNLRFVTILKSSLQHVLNRQNAKPQISNLKSIQTTI